MALGTTRNFTEELKTWKGLIDTFSNEMYGLSNRLAEVIRRSSIPGITSKVEKHQANINALSLKFHKLQLQFEKQEAAVKTASRQSDDSQTKAEMEKHQKWIRQMMERIEHEYISIRNNCHDFLLETLKN